MDLIPTGRSIITYQMRSTPQPNKTLFKGNYSSYTADATKVQMNHPANKKCSSQLMEIIGDEIRKDNVFYEVVR